MNAQAELQRNLKESRLMLRQIRKLYIEATVCIGYMDDRDPVKAAKQELAEIKRKASK